MTSRLNEQATPDLSTSWVSMAAYREYTVFGVAGDVSPRNGVTIQLRKATSAGGANATNHGSPVTADDRVSATLLADELGQNGSGVQYTHVSAVVTDEDSPNTFTALAFRSRPRVSITPNT
ncbi:MAG: hypothetical protein BroJett013_22950 [Alphaproteobacteria bacterium]|nr:MAG: hypothetical protein BroJett013_22950 [Alphaproteobacteria bacterium]